MMQHFARHFGGKNRYDTAEEGEIDRFSAVFLFSHGPVMAVSHKVVTEYEFERAEKSGINIIEGGEPLEDLYHYRCQRFFGQ